MAYQDEEFVDEYVEEEPAPARGTQRLLIIILSVGCLALAVSNVVLAMRVTQLRRAAVAERPAGAPDPAAAQIPSESEAPPASAANPVMVAPPSTAESPVPPPPPSAERPAVGRRSAAERAAPTPRETSEAPAPAASIASPAPAAAIPSPAPAASISSPPAMPEPPARATAEVSAPRREPAAKVELPPRGKSRDQARVAAVTRAPERGAPPPATVERPTPATPERPTPATPERPTPATPERATATWMIQEYGRGDAENRARAVADFYGAHSPDGAYWRRVLAEISTRR